MQTYGIWASFAFLSGPTNVCGAQAASAYEGSGEGAGRLSVSLGCRGECPKPRWGGTFAKRTWRLVLRKKPAFSLHDLDSK